MSRGIAVLILNVSARQGWVFSATLCPLYCQGTIPTPLEQELGWATGLVWTCVEKRKSLAPAWFALVILNSGSYDLIGTPTVLYHYSVTIAYR